MHRNNGPNAATDVALVVNQSRTGAGGPEHKEGFHGDEPVIAIARTGIANSRIGNVMDATNPATIGTPGA